jgi:hypothetical protein
MSLSDQERYSGICVAMKEFNQNMKLIIRSHHQSHSWSQSRPGSWSGFWFMSCWSRFSSRSQLR